MAQVLQERQDEVELPSTFDMDTDFSKMTDAEIEEAAKEQNDT